MARLRRRRPRGGRRGIPPAGPSLRGGGLAQTGAHGLTSALERALARITPELLVERTSELVRVPSLGGDEDAVQRVVAERLGQIGLEVDTWSFDIGDLSTHPGFSMEIDRLTGMGVVGSAGTGHGPTLLLNGHVDVVPVGSEARWSTAPFEPVVVDGEVRGRGALDMKGGLACAMVAAEVLLAEGFEPRGTVRIASVIGEEDGGVGTLALVDRGVAADGAIVMEPTELRVVTAQAGCRNFRVRIPGRAAHGALRTEGVNALEYVAPVLAALRELEEARNVDPGPGFDAYTVPFAISVGIARAGVWASSVPDEVVLEGRYGLRVDEHPADARAALEAAVAAAGDDDVWLRRNPLVVEWWGGRYEAARTPDEARVVRTVIAAHERTSGRATEVGAVPYGADMGLLVKYGGIPTVLYGPGDVRRAHRPDEGVPVADLVTVARTLAATVVDFCGEVG